MEYRNETFPIKGMHCLECASVIERTLMEIDGVNSVNVDFKAKNAQLEYDPNKTRVDKIDRELRNIGYEIGYDFSILDKIKELFKKH